MPAAAAAVILGFALSGMSVHAMDGRGLSALDLATLRDLDGLAVSPDGLWVAVQLRRADPQRNAFDISWNVVALGDGTSQRIADAGEPILPAYQGRTVGNISAFPPAWSPDSAWLAYVKQDAGRLQIWRTRRDGTQTEQLRHGKGDVIALAYSRDGSRLLYQTRPSVREIADREADEARRGFLFDDRFWPAWSARPTLEEDSLAGQQIRVYEFATRHERLATEGEKQEFLELTAPPPAAPERDRPAGISESNCSVSKNESICFFEEANRPRRLVAVNPRMRQMRTLFEPNLAFAARIGGLNPQRVPIAVPGGIDAWGMLVLPREFPPGGPRLPLVITTYRCSGFLRGGVGDEYPIYPLAAQGFAVLCFDAPDTDYRRLATESGPSYMRWARGPGDPIKHAVQAALDAAVAQLDAQSLIDLGRIGLTGLSFGAETVSFALFNMKSLATAIASSAGVEPSDYFLDGPAYGRLRRSWGLGSIDGEARERWHALALSMNVKRVTAPLLINVSDHEMLNALRSFTALREAGRAVEMHVFPDEFHIKWQPAHRLVVYERNIDWMNFWLRGVEDPAPAKFAQYRRWRAMRKDQ